LHYGKEIKKTNSKTSKKEASGGSPKKPVAPQTK
jgi:hypothetical protein